MYRIEAQKRADGDYVQIAVKDDLRYALVLARTIWAMPWRIIRTSDNLVIVEAIYAPRHS